GCDRPGDEDEAMAVHADVGTQHFGPGQETVDAEMEDGTQKPGYGADRDGGDIEDDLGAAPRRGAARTLVRRHAHYIHPLPVVWRQMLDGPQTRRQPSAATPWPCLAGGSGLVRRVRNRKSLKGV